MFRARIFLRAVSDEVVAFSQAKWGSHTEMLAAYNTLMAPARGIKKKIYDLKNEAMQAEWEITQCKTIDEAGKKKRAERAKANKEAVEQMLVEMRESNAHIQTSVFENAFATLAAAMPADAENLALNIGTEMNDLGVKASPSILRDLRKIFFGDSPQENSEVFFKLIERPDKMVFVTGDPNQVQQNVLDTFEKQGTQRFDSRTLDRNSVLPGNEPDHAKRLMATMKK
eukprot:RCo045950